MPKLKLTDSVVRSVQPTDSKQTEFWDSTVPDFCLRVSPGGTKTWLVRYRHNGRRPRYKLGTYPTLSLADAREQARQRLREVAIGNDPAADRNANRNADSFGYLAEMYLEKHAKRKKKSWREDERILNKEVLPRWKSIKAKDIARRDVRTLLEDTVKRGAPVHANRVLALVRKIFNFGIAEDIIEVSPCIAITRPTNEKPRERVLTASEIRAVWNGIDSQCDQLMAAIFKLGILLGQRGIEVRTMEWSEVDLQSNWWTIPSHKTKNGLSHRVFLPARAHALISELKETKEYSRWVFPSRRDPSKHINNPQKAIQRTRSTTAFHFVGHDYRRTMISHMTSMGVPRYFAKRVINHVEKDATSVYDRHSYDGEKRQALEAWDMRVGEILRGVDEANSSLVAVNAHRRNEEVATL